MIAPIRLAGYTYTDCNEQEPHNFGREERMKTLMIAVVIAAMALFSVGTVQAGCGKKVATVGKLKSYDKATKKITIEVTHTNDAKAKKIVTLSVTPSTKTMGTKKLEELIGSGLSVVSEHGKIDFIIPVTKKS